MDVVGGGDVVVVVALVALLLGVPVPVGTSGRADSAGSGSDSRFCPYPWRYALAIFQQPMIRVHLDVAVSVSGRGASSSAPASGHVHRRCSTLRAVLDPARSAQPAAYLAWWVGPGRSGAVLQHHGTDAAGQHRVDRRLGCILPHHPDAGILSSV